MEHLRMKDPNFVFRSSTLVDQPVASRAFTRMGLTPWETFCAALIGNLSPVPFIMLLIRRIFDFLRKWPLLESKIEHLEKKAHLKGRMVKNTAHWG